MCKCNLCKWGCYSCKKSFCGKKYGRLTHEHKNSDCGTFNQQFPGQCPEQYLSALWTDIVLPEMVLAGELRDSL